MLLKRLPVLAGLGLLTATAAAAPAAPEIFPLSSVRRGQTGYGLTTMKGTTPERFEFEVIGVAKNFLPMMDIILVKSDDPKLAITGFWQGMSGSPLYIDGKVACAFSYGFRFNKVAIGGCTPLHYMKEEGFAKPPRGQAGTKGRGKIAVAPSAASRAEWLKVAPNSDPYAALDKLGAPRAPWLLSTPLPPAPAKPLSSDDNMMTAAVPLSLSGFSSPAFDEAKKVLGAYPLEPMRAGGTGAPGTGPNEFVMGGAIGVQLIRGDMAATATGTVSYVDGSRVLAFGHPMFQAGEFYAPVTVSEVHTVIPSAMSAFVMASPLREVGSLVQDRQSTIMADTDLQTAMIPLDITVEGGTAEKRERHEFHVEIINNRFMTASFAGMATMNAISHFLPDRDHATAQISSKVHVKGFEPLSFVDYLYAADGATSVIGGARGLRVLVPLLMNPYAPVAIERVELEIRLTYGTNYGEIEGLRTATPELIPGKRNHVDVVMKTYDGKDIVERVPFDVPARLAGAIVQLEVTAGDSARLDAASPEDLPSLMGAFRRLLPGNVFAVSLYTADEGVSIGGRVVKDLPASALDKLKTGSRTDRGKIYRPVARSLYPTSRVLDGGHSLLLKVSDE